MCDEEDVRKRFKVVCHGVCYSFIVLSLDYRFVLSSLLCSLFVFANSPACTITWGGGGGVGWGVVTSPGEENDDLFPQLY